MNAIEFVKKFGLDRVQPDLSIVDKHGYNSLFTEDFSKQLKQIVDAFDLVGSFGGLKSATYIRNHNMVTPEFKSKLKQAIKLVEKCNESWTTSNSE